MTYSYLGHQRVKWQESTSHSVSGSWFQYSLLIQSEQANESSEKVKTFTWDVKVLNGQWVHLILGLAIGGTIPVLSNKNRLINHVTISYLGHQSVKWPVSTSHSGPGSWRHYSLLIQSEQANWITWLKVTWVIKAWNGTQVNFILCLSLGGTFLIQSEQANESRDLKLPYLGHQSVKWPVSTSHSEPGSLRRTSAASWGTPWCRAWAKFWLLEVLFPSYPIRTG